MEAPQIFLSLLAFWIAINGLLAWSLPKVFFLVNGFDDGETKVLMGHGVTLFVLSAIYIAPVLSGPKASKRVCQLSTFAYGTGVLLGWVGSNYVMVGESAVMSIGCAFCGFASSFPENEAEEKDRVEENMCVKVCVGLLAVSILADGMQALIAPHHFLTMNNLGNAGPKLVQGIGLVHVLAFLGIVGSLTSGPAAIRTYCKVGACGFATGILAGILDKNLTVLGEAFAVSSYLAFCAVVSPSKQRDGSEGLIGGQE
eukprot:TRINITY_DN46240_c0_g1_i1.p1 TRINITY_DN46240_c0_g1~~TRINITY_DN46240_c0_g1_i1.p1  ORF type:complete len:277 (+),score=29.58 TRINITY_DN46240_c0_g1_i1:64-831(+)